MLMKKRPTSLKAITLLWTGVLVLFGAVLFGVDLVSANPLFQDVGQGGGIFDQKCRACHTIGGGRLVGPDLEGVIDNRDTEWLRSFIQNPGGMIAQGDPIATQLLEEYNIQMPSLGLTDEEIGSVLAFLGESSAEGDSPAEIPTSGSAQIGANIFTGQVRLQNGGSACLACHTVDGATAFGGGSLGPNLTHVLDRYGDTGLAASLQTLPFPTMQGIFAERPLTPEEQADLYAYFEQVNGQAAPGFLSSPIWFWGAGVLGIVLLFGVMAIFWPRQRQSISDRLRSQR